jgi:hypothetical protein
VKPDVASVLGILGGTLMSDVMPHLQPTYRQASVMITGLLLGMVREESERAVARRVEENAALRALFERALPVVSDAALREKLAGAARTRDDSLLVSALDRSNDALRALLIELHAHVEELSSPAARALDDEIWRELAASTERRKLMMAPF